MPEIGAESAKAIDASSNGAATARTKNDNFTATPASSMTDLALTRVWRRRLNAQALVREGGEMFRAAVFERVLALCAVLGFSLLASYSRAAAAPDSHTAAAVHVAPAPHALIKADLESFFD